MVRKAGIANRIQFRRPCFGSRLIWIDSEGCQHSCLLNAVWENDVKMKEIELKSGTDYLSCSDSFNFMSLTTHSYRTVYIYRYIAPSHETYFRIVRYLYLTSAFRETSSKDCSKFEWHGSLNFKRPCGWDQYYDIFHLYGFKQLKNCLWSTF